jgi:hypothetical protein
MNFNGESVDNNAELDSKTQNIDLASTVPLNTNFLGVLEINGVPVEAGSTPQPWPGDFDVVGSVNATQFKPLGGIATMFLKGDGSLDLNTYVNKMGDTMSGSLTAPLLIKTGATNIEYLMGDGSTLTQSATSGNSNFYLYDNTNSTTDSTPVSGEVIINSLVNTTATIVYISHVTRDNIDIEVFWKFVNTLTELYLQDQSLSTNYIQYNITSAPTITVGDKIAIPVAVVNSAGTGSTSFGVGHNILVSFFSNNLEVDTRLSTLETKTVNQSSLASTTLFNGQTIIREASGVVIPHSLIINCDDTQGPRIIASDNALVNPKPLELSCSDFNLNCSGYNNIRCAAGQNIALIGNVNNTGYTTTSNALITTGGLSSQFVKGNGTLDSSTYLTLNPDTTQRWISSAIGNDTTGTGTLSAPWATIAKGFTTGAQYPLKLNIRGSFAISTLNLVSANSDTQITTTDGYEAQQSTLNGTIQTTGTMTRLKCSGFTFSAPTVSCLIFTDTLGRHVFDNCSFISAAEFPIFVWSSFTNWLNFNNCDFTGLTGGGLTLDPVGSACILRLYNCGVVPITIGTGWTVYISGSTTLTSPSAILGTVIQLPVEQFNAVITTQAAFNAISVDGLYINQVVGLTGLTGATFGCSFLRAGAVKLISLGYNSLPPTINVFNVSTYNTWVKNPNVSGGWVTLNQSLYLPLTGGTVSGNLTCPSFITNGGLVSQFVKGNGTLDSTDYLISPFLWSTSTITFTQAGTGLVATSGFMSTTGISNIGGSLAAVAQSSASVLLRIFKSASLTASVADGQKSGYIGTASFPKIYPGGGFNLNFSFGIGDTNTTTTAVTQCFCGVLTTTTIPLFSSVLGPNTTPNILGIGHDLGDTFFSFYMRGTVSGTKIITTIPCNTPSNGFYNLNIYNAVNSNTAVLTFTNIISNISQIYTVSFSSGSPLNSIINTSLLNPIIIRGMAIGGGVTGSAITHISRIQLSIK